MKVFVLDGRSLPVGNGTLRGEKPGDREFMCAPRRLALVQRSCPHEGEDDTLVRVRPMLERVKDWSAYFASPGKHHETESIKQHAKTGRPLGNPDFIHQLEIITGTDLAPKKPGRKPSTSK